MQKILIIEDDTWIIQPLSLYLQQHDFIILTCQNWLEALDMVAKYTPDIIILDINLPGKNWFELCEEIRNKYNTPICMLSARSQEEDKIKTLEAWADDYVEKPFSPRELLARIRSILKRYSNSFNIKTTANNFLEYKHVKLNLKELTLVVDNKEKTLTKTEFELFKYILENQGSIITRESLMKDVMWYDNYIYDRTLDTHIKNIRKKMWEPLILETVRWVGYKLV